ncbi:hypothetical protein [Ferruginibacter sp.]
MDTSKVWFDFMDLANATTEQGQKIDRHKPSIQIFFQPSFDNHTFLQLQLYNDILKWYRTTWQKLIDAPKFNDPIQKLKFIGQVIKPTIKYESGEAELKIVGHILEFIKTILIRPRLEKWGGIILDGSFYTLTISVESVETKYKWHYLPDEWTDLQKLADMLDELNNQL